MADFTICTTDSCQKIANCNRHKSKAKINKKWQAYSDFTDVCNEKNNYKISIPAESPSLLQTSSEGSDVE